MSAARLTRQPGDMPGVGIVHLGLGAFARAFIAPFVAEAMDAKGGGVAAASGGEWGMVGVSLKSRAQSEKLTPQGGVYTLLELGPEGESATHIDVVQRVLCAPDDPGAVLDLMADPGVKIVTLTVTEKGYCQEPATGRLLVDHPDIIADLSDPARPASAIGYLVRALERRRAAGIAPFTILPCDNLPDNGRVCAGVVLDLARLIDRSLADWIADECRIPSTMVDRIVPATKPEDIARVTALTGVHDASPVVHEPFRQWVIEDDFVGGERPDFGAVGVELVERVEPYELMKLRCLNGTHSSLAYLGYLAGHETIAQTVADPLFARYLRSLWAEEIIPGLTPPPGVDLHGYGAALLARYANPGIRHLTWQIAMDGSQKLPQRILSQLAEGRAAGRDMAGLILAVAAWMRFVGGVDEAGGAIDVRDPLAARLRALSDRSKDPAGKVAGLLCVGEVFSAEMAGDAAFVADLTAAYEALATDGARATLEARYA